MTNNIKDKLNQILSEGLGSFRYQSIEGPAPINKNMVKKIPKNKKKYVATVMSKIKVFLVDGKWVRDNIDVGWIGGGHPLEADWIPKNEIWIESQKDAMDQVFYLFHEIIEFIQMEVAGQKYDKSHDISNTCEHAGRQIAKVKLEG